VSIYQRKDNGMFWFNFVHRGKKYQESTQTADRREAGKKRERTFWTRIKNGEFGILEAGKKEAAEPTLGDLYQLLENEYSVPGPLTARNRSNLKQLALAFKPSILARELTGGRIDAYIKAQLAAGYKKASVNRITGLLHRAFSLAVENKVLTLADVPKIRTLDCSDNVRRGSFTQAVFDALSRELEPDLRDFAAFAFYSSWRQNEIATLTWADVAGEYIKLRSENSKDRQARVLPIAGEIANIISRRRAQRVVNGELCRFVFHRNGLPILEFRKAWASACRRANIGKKIFHDFRRSAVIAMVEAGTPVAVAMKISGHRTLAMFRRYADAGEMKDALREAILSRSSAPAAPSKVVGMAAD
jgi:integrase